MKLFSDEMLGRLGHWLRAAGYDTAIAEGGLADVDIVGRCIAEARVLITRDRQLQDHAQGPVSVIRLAEDRVENQARALRRALGIDWQYAPFTRCVVDNAPLDPAPPEMAAQVPLDSRAVGGPLRLCPECRRLYWPGGHVRRMAERFRRLASE